MKLDDIHFGQILKAKIEEIGMSKAEFARRMHVERQTVNSWWKKDSLDSKILLRACEVLNYDFFDLPNMPRPHVENSPRLFALVEIKEVDQRRLLDSHRKE